MQIIKTKPNEWRIQSDEGLVYKLTFTGVDNFLVTVIENNGYFCSRDFDIINILFSIQVKGDKASIIALYKNGRIYTDTKYFKKYVEVLKPVMDIIKGKGLKL